MARTLASTTRSTAAATRVPARERLLAAAEQLFYQEGFNTVGIDRVIEVAGVAKASLYDTFGSKDELVRAYLSTKLQAKQDAVEQELARHDTPRERLLAVFGQQASVYRAAGYRGCAFVKASAESRPDSAVTAICDDWRTWLFGLFGDLARACGVEQPETLVQQLVMLYDGASISARMDGAVDAADVAKTTASALLDMALARKPAALKAAPRA